MSRSASFRDTVRRSRHEGAAILAFNIVDPASLQGVLAAADSLRRPVVTQFSTRTVEFYGAAALRALVSATAGDRRCFLHLDHCSDSRVLEAAIGAGFDGIMADGSHLPFEENVRWTSGWVARAHARGVLVEAELGTIAGFEEGAIGVTSGGTPDPQQYTEFSRQTGVDLLGADIGTAHGVYDHPPSIRFDLLEVLAREELPGFVVHGCSGLDARTLRTLVAHRVVKMNFSTDLKVAWAAGLERELTARRSPEPLAALAGARSKVTEMALEKWRACGGDH
jgi:ketose-bisphosphate aldolase